MNQRIRKFISSLLTISTALAFTGLGLVNIAQAGRLTEATVTMSDVRSATASNHTIAFKVAGTTAIKNITIQYRADASTSATVPTSFVSTTGSLGSPFTISGNTQTDWSSSFTSNGQIVLTHTTGVTPVSGDTVSIPLSGFTNNSTSGSCDAVSNSDTCFVRIFTYSDTGGSSLIDSATTTYTVIDAITTTATVDPLLTFTVTGVSSGSIVTNDSNAGSGTQVTTTAVACPFGNVAVAAPKMCQQSLAVATNANNGYNVYSKFLGTTPSTDMMTGTYAGNNIDPFTSTWGSPGAFSAPSGTAKNVNSGWVGERTTNANVANFNSSNVYGAPYVGSNTGNQVMTSTGPDNGSTPTYVTLKIQVNAYQPSDLYTGTRVYNVVASY